MKFQKRKITHSAGLMNGVIVTSSCTKLVRTHEAYVFFKNDPRARKGSAGVPLVAMASGGIRSQLFRLILVLLAYTDNNGNWIARSQIALMLRILM